MRYEPADRKRKAARVRGRRGSARMDTSESDENVGNEGNSNVGELL